jgi:hypothetical protein
VIEQLSARKEEGLQVLKEYLAETKDFQSPTVGAVVRAIARLEGPRSATIENLLKSENIDLRGAALFAYFDDPRDETDLPLVIEILNSKAATLPQKRRFLSLLAQKNVALFDSLFAEAEASIVDEPVKEALRRTEAAVARRKAKDAEKAAQKASGAGAAVPKQPPQ